MNIQKFFFKVFVTLTYIVRVGLLIFPIALVVVVSRDGAWKYGFTFIQNTIEVAAFVAFAIGFLVSMYHALSYEVVGQGPDENYLKSKQSVSIENTIDLQTLQTKLEQSELQFKSLQLVNGDKLQGRKKVWFTPPDRISIAAVNGIVTIHSQPFTRWWFIDFGRNFKNVYDIARIIKSVK